MCSIFAAGDCSRLLWLCVYFPPSTPRGMLGTSMASRVQIFAALRPLGLAGVLGDMHSIQMYSRVFRGEKREKESLAMSSAMSSAIFVSDFTEVGDPARPCTNCQGDLWGTCLPPGPGPPGTQLVSIKDPTMRTIRVVCCLNWPKGFQRPQHRAQSGTGRISWQFISPKISRIRNAFRVT